MFPCFKSLLTITYMEILFDVVAVVLVGDGGCVGCDCGGQHGGDGGCAVVISSCLGVCIAVVLAFVPPCGRNMQVSIWDSPQVFYITTNHGTLNLNRLKFK